MCIRDRIFSSKEEVLDVIEKAILLFREQGITGERFSDTIARPVSYTHLDVYKRQHRFE